MAATDVRAWLHEEGWRLDETDLRAALQARGTQGDDLIELLDEGRALRRQDATRAAREAAPLAYTPAEDVLGALLLAGTLSFEAAAATLDAVQATGLDAAMFDRERDRLVFEAICAVIGEQEASEFKAVERELARRHKLADAGGVGYIRELSNLASATTNAAHFARMVVADARSRDHERIGLRVVEAARNGGLTPELRDQLSRIVAEPLDLHARDRLEPGGAFILDQPDTATAVWGASPDEVAWAAGEGLMIAGPQGVGKTTLMQQLALARCGLRTQVLDMDVNPDERKVLYIAADRPAQAQRSLARMVGGLDRPLLDERLVVHRGPPLPLITSDPAALARLAHRAGAGTIIVDSLKDVAAKLADDEYGGRINLAFQTVIADGVELVVGHHQRKASTDNKKPNKLDDVYGSTWITSGLGSVFLLWGEPGNAIVELNHLKQPREELGPWNIIHDHNRGTTSRDAKPDLVELVYRASTEGLTATGAAELVHEKQDPSRNEVEKIRRRLERLTDNGRIVKMPGPAGNDAPRYYFNGGTQDTLA